MQPHWRKGRCVWTGIRTGSVTGSLLFLAGVETTPLGVQVPDTRVRSGTAAEVPDGVWVWTMMCTSVHIIYILLCPCCRDLPGRRGQDALTWKFACLGVK
jgi:hypothetical protein